MYGLDLEWVGGLDFFFFRIWWIGWFFFFLEEYLRGNCLGVRMDFDFYLI